MRLVVTNINPDPFRFNAAPFAPSATWWTVCTSCESIEELGCFVIEAECQQHALDYAMQHARLTHRGEPLAVVFEEQLVFDIIPEEVSR